MNTNEILALLETHADCDGVERYGSNGLIFFLDQAQSILLDVSAEQNIVFDSQGRLPSFNTEQGVYEYAAPANARKIAGILVESYETYERGAIPLVHNYFYSDYSYTNFVRSGNIEQDHVLIAGIDYYRIPYVRSYDATDTAPAKIVFTEDPNTFTDLYRWWYYKKPTKILSESIPLSIDPPNDYLYLLPATIALIQGWKDGDFLESTQKVMMLQKKMNQELNCGEQGQDYNAVDRGF
jgi:hypothetical protein